MMFGMNTGTDETWKHIPENSVGVELGVWKGDSSEKFLRKAHHLYLVDSWGITPYEKSDEFGDYDSYLQRYSKLVGSSNPDDFKKYYDQIFESVKARFQGRPVTFFRGTTDEFFKLFNAKVDWVYVDASHAYEQCLEDLINSLNIVKSGGYIFGDDYGNKEGVVRAVNTFVNETNLKLNNFHSNQYKIQVL